MTDILEKFVEGHSRQYQEIVSILLQFMPMEEMIKLPALRIDDETRRVAERDGCVFSVYKENGTLMFYSLGGTPYRLI